MGAQIPIWAYVGRKPTPIVASPIREIVIIKTGLRPIRSPIEPNIAAPIGLTIIPIPNVARLANRLALGSAEGKKVEPKKVAKVANIRKSYHSRKVPKQAAIATCR